MNGKILMVLVMGLVLVGCANALTQAQLDRYTEQQITTLASYTYSGANLQLAEIVFTASSQTIIPLVDGNYNLIKRPYFVRVSIDEFATCLFTTGKTGCITNYISKINSGFAKAKADNINKIKSYQTGIDTRTIIKSIEAGINRTG